MAVDRTVKGYEIFPRSIPGDRLASVEIPTEHDHLFVSLRFNLATEKLEVVLSSGVVYSFTPD